VRDLGLGGLKADLLGDRLEAVQQASRPVSAGGREPAPGAYGLAIESIPRLYRVIRGLAQSSKPANTSYMRACSGGELERSELWRECLAPCGVGDGLSLSCGDQTGVWGHLAAQRREQDRHFAESNLFLLEEASPSIARLMRRSVIHSPATQRPGMRAPAPAVVILGPDLDVRGRTAGVRDWLAQFPDAPLAQGWGQLPAAVYAVVGRLRGAGESVARAHELSSRESMLARHVVNRLGTSEIAERLSIVPYTVKDHLKSIFRKTGVSSRGELASRLTGRI
jgi:DNA-binding CsgD family transcriptional regulator